MLSIRFDKTAAVLALLASTGCVTLLAQTQTQTQTKSSQQTQAKPKDQTQPQKTQPRQAPVPLYSGVGTTPTAAEMGNLVFAAGFSGKDLPAGSGNAKQGEQLYLGRCAMCHGADLEGVPWDPGAFSPIHGPRLGGGNSTPTFDRAPGRITNLAYTAPSPIVIFDTIAVEMPMFKAGTLKPDEVYALTALILFKNGLIKEDEIMNREALSELQMPNRKSFPASDDVYMDMKKRGCYKTYGVCLGD